MANIEKDLNTKFESEWVKAIINIKYTSGWLDQLGNKILHPFNISEPQFNILRILRGAKEPITVKTIKDRMIQKSPNATRLMDKLCDKKLIERVRCENDRRAVYVDITEDGLSLLEKIDMKKMNNEMNMLSEMDAVKLNKLLDKIRKG